MLANCRLVTVVDEYVWSPVDDVVDHQMFVSRDRFVSYERYVRVDLRPEEKAEIKEWDALRAAIAPVLH